jgi:cell division protein FtsB
MNMIGQSAKYIVVLAGLVFLAFLVIIFNNRMAEQRQLAAQAEDIRAELNALQLTDANLDAQIAYATSDLAVREWAYQEARWVREGDQPIVPVSPSKATPVLPPTEEEVEQQVFNNWDVWWALFFDDGIE